MNVELLRLLLLLICSSKKGCVSFSMVAFKGSGWCWLCFWMASERPISSLSSVLSSSITSFALTLYLSFIYGLLYCFLTAYTVVFQNAYGMSAGVGG